MIYLIKIIKHKDGERLPILVNEKGFPYVQPNEFILTQRGLAWRTLKKKLYAISLLYRWTDSHAIDIQARIESGQFFSEAEINGSLFNTIRKSNNRNKISRIAVGAKTFNTYIIIIKEYLQWIFSSFLVTLPATDHRFKVSESKQRIILTWLNNAQLSSSNAENEISKGLNQNQQRLLLDLVHPDSKNNPFNSEDVRHRNYIIILILLNFGLRPSELLLIKVKNLIFGSISQLNLVRNPHDPEDPRLAAPEMKRNGRVLNILGNELANALDNYIQEYRCKLAEKNPSGTNYLILSDEGDPFSYSSITKLFIKLRSHENGLPENFTAMSLRHTFSYNTEKEMRNAGVEKDQRKKILKYLRGDSNDRSQERYTKEAIKEEARTFLKAYQTKIFSP